MNAEISPFLAYSCSSTGVVRLSSARVSYFQNLTFVEAKMQVGLPFMRYMSAFSANPLFRAWAIMRYNSLPLPSLRQR